MKKVTKFESNNGRTFDTEEEALKEDLEQEFLKDIAGASNSIPTYEQGVDSEDLLEFIVDNREYIKRFFEDMEDINAFEK